MRKQLLSTIGFKEQMEIAIVSSCLPRRCGIATFSSHLSQAIEENIGPRSSFIPLNNNGSFAYPQQPICEIDQENLRDYYEAAGKINSAAVDVVSLQHEFGLFGGSDGIFINAFLKHVKKPVVTTFHTVLQTPSAGQKEAFKNTAALSSSLVVMNRLAISFMTEIYGIPASKINLIPHGVRETEYKEPSHYKNKLACDDRFLILTFGFLSPNKGIETVLKALPAAVKKNPRLLYMVLGITHPVEKKSNGEKYRASLKKMVTDLKLGKNVLFIDAFLDDEEMDLYIGASDLVVCPYNSEAQITSGVLSIALSKGKTIISTPYLHAKEALTEGRGCLVNCCDPAAMSTAIIHLMENPLERQSMADKALALGRQMSWGNVSRQYLNLFSKVKELKGKTIPAPQVRECVMIASSK